VLNVMWFPAESGEQFASDGELLYRKVGNHVQYTYWAWLPLSVKWEPWLTMPRVPEALWQDDLSQIWELPQLGQKSWVIAEA